MASFAARAEIMMGPGANDDQFDVNALFTLGAGNNGIDPLTEEVTLGFGGGLWTIPAGWFHLDRKGRFKFEGYVDGTYLDIKIIPLSTGGFGLKAEGAGLDLSGVINPVTVGLTIGNDSGTTQVMAKIEP